MGLRLGNIIKAEVDYVVYATTQNFAGNNTFILPQCHFHESYKVMKLNLGMWFSQLSGTNNAVLLTTDVYSLNKRTPRRWTQCNLSHAVRNIQVSLSTLSSALTDYLSNELHSAQLPSHAKSLSLLKKFPASYRIQRFNTVLQDPATDACSVSTKSRPCVRILLYEV